MTMLIALLLAAPFGRQPQGTPAWVEAFHKTCPPAKAQANLPLNRQQATRTTKSGSGPGRLSDGRTSLDDPVATAMLRAWAKFEFAANNLLSMGRYEDAYQAVAQEELDHPGSREYDVPLASTCDILTGRIDAAYSLLSEAMARGWHMNEGSYLNLSIVCAARGQVFPGQREFILNQYQLGHGFALDLPEWAAITSTPPRSSREVMIASALATGLRGGDGMFGYLELVLKWDPSNKVAAHEAILCYGYKGRYSDLRRIATQMLRRTNDKSEREYYAAELKKVEGLPDRKQEARKNPFDNAGPPPP